MVTEELLGSMIATFASYLVMDATAIIDSSTKEGYSNNDSPSCLSAAEDTASIAIVKEFVAIIEDFILNCKQSLNCHYNNGSFP